MSVPRFRFYPQHRRSSILERCSCRVQDARHVKTAVAVCFCGLAGLLWMRHQRRKPKPAPDASAPAAGATLQLVAVPARIRQQPQVLHRAGAPRPAQIWFGLRLPMLWQQQAGAVVLLFGSTRVVRGVASQGWWLIVEAVRLSHVIQAGPLVCLVCVMHVAMLHITAHGIQSIHLVMWRVGMSAPVPRPHSQAVEAEPVVCLPPAHVTGCLGLGMPARPLLLTLGARDIANVGHSPQVAARSNGTGLEMRALLRCMASSTGLRLCLPLCAAPLQDASAPAAGTALQLVAVPARTQQQPQILHGARAPRPAQIWLGLRLPMFWQQQAGAVVLLFGSRRVVRGGASQGRWLIVEAVRVSHVIQAGPLVCLVCVMHVAMLHITPHGVKSIYLVMWRVGMSAPVPRPHSQAVEAEPVVCLPPAHVTGCLGLGMPARPLLLTLGARDIANVVYSPQCELPHLAFLDIALDFATNRTCCLAAWKDLVKSHPTTSCHIYFDAGVAARSNRIGLDIRALLRCMASSTGLRLCLPLCAAPPQVALLCPRVQGGSCLHPPCLQPSVGMLLVTDLVCLKREETSVLDRKALKAPEATSISPHKESLQELPCLTSAELGSACVVLSAPFGNIPKVLSVEPAVTPPQLTTLAPAQASASGWRLPNRQQLDPASPAATGSGTPAAAAPPVAAAEDKSGSPAKRHAISKPPAYAILEHGPSPVPTPPSAAAPPAAVIEPGSDPKQPGSNSPAHDGLAILEAILGRKCHMSHPTASNGGRAILIIPPPPAVDGAGSASQLTPLAPAQASASGWRLPNRQQLGPASPAAAGSGTPAATPPVAAEEGMSFSAPKQQAVFGPPFSPNQATQCISSAPRWPTLNLSVQMFETGGTVARALADKGGMDGKVPATNLSPPAGVTPNNCKIPAYLRPQPVVPQPVMHAVQHAWAHMTRFVPQADKAGHIPAVHSRLLHCQGPSAPLHPPDAVRASLPLWQASKGWGNDGLPTQAPERWGRGRSSMAAPGRGAGRGAGMAPPPGLAADQGRLQGLMAPMPGVDRRGGRGKPASRLFSAALGDALRSSNTDHSHGDRWHRHRGEAQRPLSLQRNPEAVPAAALADPLAAPLLAPVVDPLAGPPSGPLAGPSAAPIPAPPAGSWAAPPPEPVAVPPPSPPARQRPRHTELRHTRPLLTMTHLHSRIQTLSRGYPLVYLPEEAEPGDEDTAAAIMRDAERQREEQKWKLRDQKHAERFNKRVWHHQSLQELWSQPLSRQQVQEKVLGAFSERRDSAELKDKVQGFLPFTQASLIFEQIPLVAIQKMRNVDWRLIRDVMVHLCCGDQPTLPKPAVQSGTRSLLNTMRLEHVVRHAPKAADWVGGVLGALVSAGTDGGSHRHS